MKLINSGPFFLVLVLCLVSCHHSRQSGVKNTPRKIYDFDLGWKFSLGDFPQATGLDFDDSRWRSVNVPHDWSIEGKYDSLNHSGIAGAFLPVGTGWYRKRFEWQKEWENKKIFIEFDGVYCNATVWINGIALGARPNGYISFSYDLTPYLQKGENVVSVKVDHSKSPSGRWYTGSGIYRHVRLLATERVYVPKEGLFITTPVVDEKSAQISVALEVINDGQSLDKTEISCKVVDHLGKKLSDSSAVLALGAGTNRLKMTFHIQNPNLWSPDNPYLYTWHITIKNGTRILDEYQSAFGIRSISFSAENGFLLNGVKTILKGVCMHHDAGPVGAAVPNDVLYRRIKLLKGMGCNAIRTSHNPFAPEFYAMCDSIGVLVMNEAFDGWEQEKAKFDYGHYFEDWWEKDLEAFIKRDRNHPSVIIWSIGNEVKGYTNETQQMLYDFIKKLDDTRPVSQGRGYNGPAVDLAGFNGHGEFKEALKHFHEKYPDKPVVGTEITHSYQTRGVYRTKTWYRRRDFPAPWERGKPFSTISDKIFLIDDLTEKELFEDVPPYYQSSYDNSIVRMGVRDYWKETRYLPYFVGAFRWTGFDYLGESFGWPARTVSFGVIDLAGFPTDQYYLYQSIWSDKPMVHMLPHWTHHGKEGMEIPVVVYTNCGSAELFLNGISLGEKPMTDDLQIVWNVPYQKGKLEVVAKTNGREIVRKSYRTSEKPQTIEILLDKETIKANQKDIVHAEMTIVGENGIPVPHADNLLTFDIKGPGKIIGVENGDILDLNPHKVNYRSAFNGKCLVILQSLDREGEITLTVKSDGLEQNSARVLVKSPGNTH
ncbi:glycoside hydrolase family 2 TIM barrel-domain containing protein [Fulvivirgaceae bacterium BMA12]|uniref:Glycoside hydrolase family 2 TIM barrel-domain containing protein n=1 Tax=Agaribacillus aureus TaxID=3051825 RepID=A0ABT8LGH1_9BACT|nr:glycoside hydrolase family 2 TIM barrel-domain containing protein [Fulvivirgaceae bacterium BMA12]